MDYQIIYDTLTDVYSLSNNWTYMSIFCLILIIGAIKITVDRYNSNQNLSLSIFVFILLFLLFLLLFLKNNIIEYKQYRNLVTKIENKHYTIVEGRIKDFKPISKYDKAEEEFSVKNVSFKYSPHKNLKVFGSVKGQNKQGNPLEENLLVRITYYFDKNWNTNLILKLEIIPTLSKTKTE
jgi:hypothetical protein